MEERTATLEDYRLYGAKFGVEISEAVQATRQEGMNKDAIRDHVIAGMIPVKDAQLRVTGATDVEIGEFMRAAGQTAKAVLRDAGLFTAEAAAADDAVTAPNRQKRRAMRAGKIRTHERI